MSCLIYVKFCQAYLLGFCVLECKFITNLVIRELPLCNMKFVLFTDLPSKKSKNITKIASHFKLEWFDSSEQTFLYGKVKFVCRNYVRSGVIFISTSVPTKTKDTFLRFLIEHGLFCLTKEWLDASQGLVFYF